MPYITFSKSYSSSDDGSKLTGADIGQLETDIAQVLNGGITNVNISGTAAIGEAKIAFDTVAGHTHNGTDSANVAGGNVLRADITGCKPVYVSVDTVNAESGALEINGIIYTRNAVSSTINLSTDAHWVGNTELRATSSTFYIYAYNDSGTTWNILFSDTAPAFANCGTDTEGVKLFLLSGGVWYRCIGTATTNATGSGELSSTSIAIYPATSSSGAFPSIFGQFGGNGEDGAKTISADANFSDHDGSVAGVAQYTTLTIDTTKILTINTKFAFIGVSGNCTIHGTITAAGNMVNGGAADTQGASGLGVTDDADMILSLGQAPIMGSLAGAGGGGAGSPAGACLGKGGGAGASGGNAGSNNAIGTPAVATAPYTTTIATMILNAGGIPDALMQGGGGGGGGGKAATAGGAGGGILYIEVAGALVYDGVLSAAGAAGANGGAAGGAGGGGGGIVIIRAQTITTNTGTTSVIAGTGGTGTQAGGNGAAGYSAIVEI